MKGKLVIRFVEVGRGKATWVEEIPGRREAIDEILTAVVKRRVLMSRGIEVVANEEGNGGEIFAGLHCVGRFEVLENVRAL